MASDRNLCQHSDIDGTQCTSNDYILCPHCQLQLCLKHLNYHQDLLRSDLYVLCDHVNLVQSNLDNLVFDETNHRQDLYKKLDDWYYERINWLNRIYAEKQQQLQILCLQAQMEFDTYKAKKDKELKDNLIKQLKKIIKQKQIHMNDLNGMKNKLENIEKGLNELKQLLIDIQIDRITSDINIVKRRYVEASKPSFNDDDDNLWDTDDEDDILEEKTKLSDDIEILEEFSTSVKRPLSPDIILLQTPEKPPICSTTNIVKKAPLKLIIKRLQQPTTSTKAKYKLQTVTTSTPTLIT